MENVEKYKVTIDYTYKDLMPAERIAIKDTSDCESLDTLTQIDGSVEIHVENIVYLTIENPKATQKRYGSTIIIGNGGSKYITSSESMRTKLDGILEEFSDNEYEGDFKIKVFRKESKNYAGKQFITCSFIA